MPLLQEAGLGHVRVMIGMIQALEAGFFRCEIADAAFVYQQEVDAKLKLIGDDDDDSD